MAAHGRGGGKTPSKVVELVNMAVAEKSLRAVSKATGLGIAALSRYSQGIGEPSQATLEKLARYFGVRVRELRGESVEPLDRLFEGLRIRGISVQDFNAKLAELHDTDEEDYDRWGALAGMHEDLPPDMIDHLCDLFEIDAYWVKTGQRPTFLTMKGIVGTVTDRVIVGSKFIPGWEGKDFGFTPPPLLGRPSARCARCGGELQLDNQDHDPHFPKYWPCTRCCKG